MSKSKALYERFSCVLDVFKGNNDKYNKTALVFTILNIFSSFFLLSSLFSLQLNVTDFSLLARQSIGLYILFALSLLMFALSVMSLTSKQIKFNINIFLLLYFIFQLPTLNSVTFLFFILIGLSLYYYPYLQKKEIEYAKKINIRRRIPVGLYFVILISSIAMATNFTSQFSDHMMYDLVDNVFTHNGEVHDYMGNVYDKYLNDEKFKVSLHNLKNTIAVATPEEIFNDLDSLPEELQWLLSPNVVEMLNSQLTKEEFKTLKREILSSLDGIENVSSRDLLLERLINIGSGQVKGWISPYKIYIKFYFGYSVFVILILLSPFLLIFLSWLSALIFIALKKGDVLRIIKENQEVEYIKKV